MHEKANFCFSSLASLWYERGGVNAHESDVSIHTQTMRRDRSSVFISQVQVPSTKWNEIRFRFTFSFRRVTTTQSLLIKSTEGTYSLPTHAKAHHKRRWEAEWTADDERTQENPLLACEAVSVSINRMMKTIGHALPATTVDPYSR